MGTTGITGMLIVDCSGHPSKQRICNICTFTIFKETQHMNNTYLSNHQLSPLVHRVDTHTHMRTKTDMMTLLIDMIGPGNWMFAPCMFDLLLQYLQNKTHAIEAVPCCIWSSAYLAITIFNHHNISNHHLLMGDNNHLFIAYPSPMLAIPMNHDTWRRARHVGWSASFSHHLQ